MSAAGYRKLFDNLPPGADGDPTRLYLVVKVRSERFTMTLAQRPDERYEIIAFDR